MPEGMDLVLGREVNLVHLINYIPQKIPVDHPIDGTLEYFGDDVPPVAIRALEQAEIREESCALLPIRPHRLFLVDERNDFRSRHPVRLRSPIAPALACLIPRPEPLAREV